MRNEEYVEESPAEKEFTGNEEERDAEEDYTDLEEEENVEEPLTPEEITDDDLTQPLYHIGIKFHRILDEERDIIVNWIMKRQRDLLIASEAKAKANKEANSSAETPSK
jgi:hypothetical protein